MSDVYDALIRAAAHKLEGVVRQAGRSGTAGQVTVWAVPPDDNNRKNGRLVVAADGAAPVCPVGKLPTVIRPRGFHSRWDSVPYTDFYFHLWESCRSAQIMPVYPVTEIDDGMGGIYRPGVIIGGK